MEPFIGMIVLFGGNFAPRGWAQCNGQLLPIAENTALFSILGTIYGGDGRTTFGLPDLRGRAPIGYGSGPGLSTWSQGQKGGFEQNTLTAAQMPVHSHSVETAMDAAPGTESRPAPGLVPAETNEDNYGPGTTPVVTSHTTSTAGGSEPVNNIPPSIGMNYIIALQGIYPSRS